MQRLARQGDRTIRRGRAADTRYTLLKGFDGLAAGLAAGVPLLGVVLVCAAAFLSA